MSETPYLREPGYALRYRDQRFHSGSGAGTDQRERRVLRRLLQHCPPTQGLWLDAPSGAGRLSGELPGPVVQADRDPAMVQACAGAFARTCASVHRLPFADRTFAGGLCHRLLQHIPTAEERITILLELRRVVQGPLVVSFFDRCSLQHLRRQLRTWLGRPSGRHAVSRRAFRSELGAAGWQVTAMHALRRGLGEQTLVLCRPAPPN
ncbi:MAG: class I SAM-dependent methyltransferase [Planctomycetes bacterium]|nr:class I SAM-dependent methyltransferase [Planctomycetota bacterium]